MWRSALRGTPPYPPLPPRASSHARFARFLPAPRDLLAAAESAESGAECAQSEPRVSADLSALRL